MEVGVHANSGKEGFNFKKSLGDRPLRIPRGWFKVTVNIYWTACQK